jgi:hypothetical protein
MKETTAAVLVASRMVPYVSIALSFSSHSSLEGKGHGGTGGLPPGCR